MNDTTKMAISASSNCCNHSDSNTGSGIKSTCSICKTDEYNNSSCSLTLDSLSRFNDDSTNFDDFLIDDVINQEGTKAIETSILKTELQSQCSATCTINTATDDSYVHPSSALSTSSYNGLSAAAQDSYDLLMQERQSSNDDDDENESVNNSDDDFYDDDDDDDDTFSYNSTDALMDPDDDDDNYKDSYNRVVRVHNRVNLNEITESRRHVHFGCVTIREYYCNESDDNNVSINAIQSNDTSFVNMPSGRISSAMFESSNNIAVGCINSTNNAENSKTTSLSDDTATTITSEVTFPTSKDYISYKRLMQGLAKRQQEQEEHDVL